MPIVAVLNPKGGSGKTTLSTNLAACLLRQERSVLLVDTDPQGSARDWHAAKEDNPIELVALDRAGSLKSLRGLAASFEWVVVDGAAKLADMLAGTIKAADCVLIPVQPSPYDVWAAEDVVDLIRARQEVTEGMPRAAFIVTRQIQGTKLGREVIEALQGYELPLFANGTVQRQAYPASADGGLSVFEAADPKAHAEIEAITAELLQFCK